MIILINTFSKTWPSNGSLISLTYGVTYSFLYFDFSNIPVLVHYKQVDEKFVTIQ